MINRQRRPAIVFPPAQVPPFYERLYQAAVERLAVGEMQDEFSLAAAVIIAGTAAETAVEVALTAIIERDQLGPVAEVAHDSIRSHNLKDPKDRKVWKAVTGDKIDTQPFWKQYLKHVDRRNKVVHSGRIDRQPVTPADAEESVRIVRQFLDHVTRVLSNS